MDRFLRPAVIGLGLTAAGVLHGQITETPDTVQPGHFLLEVDAITLTVDREPGLKYTAFGAATTFLTTGLTTRLDLQVGAQFFINQKFDAGGFTERHSGMGDVYLRSKYRFFESNDTYTAVAIMPYVKLPTNSGGVGNKSIEGGVIVPMKTELVGGFSFEAMGELDFLRNDNDDGYDSYWFASAYVSRNLTKAIGCYGEATAGKSSGGQPWAGSAGFGVTLAVSEHAWWDYAVYRGISRGASDWDHALRFNYSF